MAIKLIAIDIDGTLVKDDKTLAQQTVDTVQQALQLGIKIVLCTGRPLTGVRDYLDQLGIDGDDQYVVTFNGAMAQTTAGKILAHHTLTLDEYIDLEAYARKMGIHFHMETSDYLYTANRDISPYTIAESFLVRMPIRYRSTDEITDEFTISKGMFIDEPSKIDALIKAFSPELASRFYLVRSEPYFYEAMNKEASKGNAIADLGRLLDIRQSEIMAIGDQGNDLSMVQYAGVGVAMGNAIADVKAAAQHITKTNEENGVAYAISEWAL
ncbi:sugar-phosphatase [Secundilactobacillus kimchicus]|uniref:sugar-phosphatase n=1 Tax=Secundilactobacillus kimchicus TaxID=528209 RepID=UPI0024A9F033|nr:sugar-phosphatase [Secundilactobacillus kimchicus]